MPKLLLTFLALIGLTLSAQAQLPLTGAGLGAPSGGAATPTWTGTDSSQAAQGAYASATLTWTGVSLGAASSSRVVVVAVAFSNSACSLTSGSIGGVTATVAVTSTTHAHGIAIMWAVVPTGTTGNVVITTSSSVWGPTNILVGALTGTATNGTGGNVVYGFVPQTITQTVPTNGFMIAAFNDDQIAGNATTLGNGTYTYHDISWTGGLFSLAYNSSAGSQTMTINDTHSFDTLIIGSAAFGP